MTIMNEIVGESGERTGEGCLMAVVLALAAVVSVAVMAVWSWLM